MIAFDLDGVLVDLMPVIKDEIEKAGDQILPGDQYHVTTHNGMSNRVFWECVAKAYKRTKDICPCTGAQELLEVVHETTNRPIDIVTARPSWSATETYLSLEEIFKVPLRVVFAKGGSKEKWHYLRGYRFFVEDRRRTACELGSHGITTFLMDAPYNQMADPPNVARIYGLKQLTSLIMAEVIDIREGE